jgi:hypothetical protein
VPWAHVRVPRRQLRRAAAGAASQPRGLRSVLKTAQRRWLRRARASSYVCATLGSEPSGARGPTGAWRRGSSPCASASCVRGIARRAAASAHRARDAASARVRRSVAPRTRSSAAAASAQGPLRSACSTRKTSSRSSSACAPRRVSRGASGAPPWHQRDAHARAGDAPARAARLASPPWLAVPQLQRQAATARWRSDLARRDGARARRAHALSRTGDQERKGGRCAVRAIRFALSWHQGTSRGRRKAHAALLHAHHPHVTRVARTATPRPSRNFAALGGVMRCSTTPSVLRSAISAAHAHARQAASAAQRRARRWRWIRPHAHAKPRTMPGHGGWAVMPLSSSQLAGCGYCVAAARAATMSCSSYRMAGCACALNSSRSTNLRSEALACSAGSKRSRAKAS